MISFADQKKLADAFVKGRDRTSSREVQDMIRVATRRIHADFEKIPVEVRFTERDPYKSMLEMRDQVRSTGILWIWTGASDVPMWDRATNWKARAVHDWQHISEAFDFTMDGEYEGFRAAARKAPRLAPLYFSEIAMQAAVANTYGDFPGAQKIVIPSPEEFRHLRGLGPRPLDNPAFRRWFGASKVVDENGEPLVVWHGSCAQVHTFRESEGGALGPGIYLADTPEQAAFWAQRKGCRPVVHALYAVLENPYRWTDADSHQHPDLINAAARRRGHDGIVLAWMDGSVEYVAFSPTQIKSATDNEGTYDPNDPSILKGLEAAPRFDAAQVAVMRTVMTEAEIAKLMGALGVGEPLTRIEAGRIYAATVQGQVEK